MNKEVLAKIGIHVILKGDFPLVCETLERIGIINRKEKKVYPSCYCLDTQILDENGNKIYTIVHFKEMFLLQDKESTFNEVDQARLRTISYFMNKWELVRVINPDDIKEILTEKIPVLSHVEKIKHGYTIVHKFRHNK